MNLDSKKIIINIEDENYINWQLCLKDKLKNIKSNILEIDCKTIDLTCKDILEIVKIASQNDCEIISFFSSSLKTIVSSRCLGYRSQFIMKDYSNNLSSINYKNSNTLRTHFHEGTVRSGEYIDIPGNLFIFGDVNPGAIVSAEKNIIIWGRLLGIAHAGSRGNSKATISALQLRPVQLRIANKVARGPKKKLQLYFAEQAQIDSGEIVISPLDSIYFGKFNQKGI